MIRLFAILLALSGCQRESCLGGEENCRVASPCQKLRFSCDSPSLEVRRLDGAAGLPGPEAAGARGDILLSNGEITAVIAGLGNSNYLDASGGGLIDLARKDGRDPINLVLQTVGILPDDSPNYTSLEILDERPLRVAVQLRGTLLHRGNMGIATLYEVRPCEPGVRIRTEVINGTTESQLWALSDGFYWSKDTLLPFTPGPGFDYLSFGLLDIDDAYKKAPLMAASTHTPPHAAIAQVGCDLDELEGFHSAVVSASGRPRTVVPPRAPLVFERFLAVTTGGDVASAIDLALDLRGQLHGDRAATLRGGVGRSVRDEGDVSIVISDLDSGAKWTQVVPDAAGAFAARVPVGKKYKLELHNLGRVVATGETSKVEGDLDLGVIAADDNPRVTVTVKDGDGNPLDAIVYVVPADEATRASSEGTLYGSFERCAPWLGTPTGASPACNRLLVAARSGGRATVAIAKGNYHFYGFHGPFFTLARSTAAVESGTTMIDLTLRALPLLPPGALSADLHVHGGASFDSTLPDADRVLSFAAANVDVIIATDHDVIDDVLAGAGRARAGRQALDGERHRDHRTYPLQLRARRSISARRRPLQLLAAAPRSVAAAGRCAARRVLRAWRALRSARADFFGAADHAAQSPLGRRRLRARPRLSPRARPEPHQGFTRQRRRNTGRRLRARAARRPSQRRSPHPRGDERQLQLAPPSVPCILVLHAQSGADSHRHRQQRLAQPQRQHHRLAAQRSDGEHARRRRLRRRQIQPGAARGKIVRHQRPAHRGQRRRHRAGRAALLASGRRALENSRRGRALGSRRRGPRRRQRRGGENLRELTAPGDPFGSADLVRYSAELDLAEILPAPGDAWIVVEAGAALPLFGDLDGDGVPDTGDNDGNGVVDARDVAKGETTGPLDNPPLPEASHRAFHFSQVVTGGYPFAFTNPFILDRDGNGRFEVRR